MARQTEDEVVPATVAAATIRAFYERHPYPGPLNTLDGSRAEFNDRQARICEHHLFWPAEPFRENRSILIAGCGTVQAARHARRWPQARVVGTDISEASLAATRALKQRYGLGNLELRHLAIEESGQLDETFDQIICTGVLHHLPDPDAGLSALRQVLAPRGAMHLMVYAPYGRAGIYLLQDYAQLLGLGSTQAEIRDFAAALKFLPKGHPLWAMLRSSPELQYDAGLTYALLHPQDRPYSVPQLYAFIARCGLSFGRWLRQAPYLPDCGAPHSTPHHARLATLAAAAQYAAMELYRGTMMHHSAILYRDDEAGEDTAISFERRGWLRYVPLRLPETICVDERVPPGKAGVLINPQHTDTDIYLPITAEEKRVVEAIDGKRSIASLAKIERLPGSGRELFRRLWQHDQIVFDASRKGAR